MHASSKPRTIRSLSIIMSSRSCLLDDIYGRSHDVLTSCFKKAHFLHNQLHHKWYNTFIANSNSNLSENHSTTINIESVIKVEPKDCDETREENNETTEHSGNR
eukprot:319308_1